MRARMVMAAVGRSQQQQQKQQQQQQQQQQHQQQRAASSAPELEKTASSEVLFAAAWESELATLADTLAEGFFPGQGGTAGDPYNPPHAQHALHAPRAPHTQHTQHAQHAQQQFHHNQQGQRSNYPHPNVTSWAQPPSHLQQYRSPPASASMAASALGRFSEDSLITLQDLGTLTAHIMGTPAPAHGWAGGERVLDGPTAAMVLQVRTE